jgi:DNA-binding MurR/RpiR family transcriptional regulator
VAEVVLADPQLVAFGTVAELSARSNSGAATVVRLAGKLGFDGFTGLQAAVQRDLASQLRPAAERIRQPLASDQLTHHLQLELANVQSTLGAVASDALHEAVAMIADHERRVIVLSGDASVGVARQLVCDLSALRDDVALLDGNPVAVRRSTALLRSGDVVITIDLRRYDRWVVDACEAARQRGASVIALVDSVLSPIAERADHTFVIAAAGAGPFDSHVGTLALLNVLVAGVASALRDHAAERLAVVEAAWRDAGDLTDR